MRFGSKMRSGVVAQSTSALMTKSFDIDWRNHDPLARTGVGLRKHAAVVVDDHAGSGPTERRIVPHRRTLVGGDDVGRILNPIVVEGQIRGGFAHGFGAAMFEELAFDPDGNFLSGTFADYLCPTSGDLPTLVFDHFRTDTPQNSVGSKGMGDGSSMLTPVVMANAVADALDRDDIELPLTLNRVWQLANQRRIPE